MENCSGFKKLTLNEHYDSQKDDLLKDFYIPVLGETRKYQRVVGYFNSKSLATVAPGLKNFILNNGKMELICGVDLSPSDVNIIKIASESPEKVLESNFLKQLDNLEDEIVFNHVKILGWMVAKKLLRIRVAVKLDENGIPSPKQEGILHYKIGIMKDKESNVISFSGSINETAKAWKDNLEEFHLFKSWNSYELGHLKENIDTFSDLWNSKRELYKIYDIPSAVEEKLIDFAPSDFNDLVFDEDYIFPSPNPSSEISLFDYQIDAGDCWVKNNKRGIFEMATGTGKTFTALGCLKRELESNEYLLTVITAPTKHLLPQWKKSIDDFGLKYDKLVYATGDFKWKSILENISTGLYLNDYKKVIILTIHDIFARDEFRDILKQNKICPYFLIGDEMHGLGSNFRKRGLSEIYDFRLGLSATPTRFDDLEFEFLLAYFGEILFEFPLKKAIYSYNPKTKLSYLTPYNYYPYFTNLTKEELEKYKELTLKLFKYDPNDSESNKRIENLYYKRAEIIKDAHNKYSLLEEILDDIDDVSGLIIYCSYEQIDNVVSILSKRNIISRKFDMKLSTKPSKELGGLSPREDVLNDFAKGDYQVLTAMHCLDEGVDVPSASKAIFMCSSNSTREFIQRIGRVIRRYKNKNHADIYDLIVTPSLEEYDDSLKKFEEKIFEKEMERYEKIGLIAENYKHVLNAFQNR